MSSSITLRFFNQIASCASPVLSLAKLLDQVRSPIISAAWKSPLLTSIPRKELMGSIETTTASRPPALVRTEPGWIRNLISDTKYGEDDFRPRWLIFDFVAQVYDVTIKRPVDNAIIGADKAAYLFASERAASV